MGGAVELVLDVHVAAPPERVWAAMVDWDRQGEWMLATRAHGVQGGEYGGIEALTGFGPIAIRDTMRITGWDPPHECRVVHTGRIVRGTGVFRVDPVGEGGSTFTWSESLDLPLGALGRLGWPVVRPAFRWGVRRSLGRFAEWATTYPA